jgi:hypothetical protein
MTPIAASHAATARRIALSSSVHFTVRACSITSSPLNTEMPCSAKAATPSGLILSTASRLLPPPQPLRISAISAAQSFARSCACSPAS